MEQQAGKLDGESMNMVKSGVSQSKLDTQELTCFGVGGGEMIYDQMF